METVIILIGLLFIKHFIVDFPLQKPYQWQNKGTYGHPGGLLHAGLHGIGTFLCFLYVTPLAYAPLVAITYLAVFDAVVHYHVDWLKMNINALYGWRPDRHEAFWVALGVDQLAHALTYIGIVWYVFA